MGLKFNTTEVDAALAKLLQADWTPALDTGAGVLRQSMSDHAPVASGELRDTMYSTVTGPLTPEAGSELPYAPDTEFRSSRPGWAAAALVDSVEGVEQAVAVEAAVVLESLGDAPKPKT